MELLIAAAVVIALALILGVSGFSIMLVIYCVAAVILLAMTVFFIVSAVMLAGCKRSSGVFERFEKNGKFETAVYSADGKEYKNLFPAESIMRSRIYSAGERRLFVRSGKKRSFCLDTHSVVIIVSGCVLSPISLAVMLAQISLFI